MPAPVTSVLDSFTRADENPLANSTWTGPIVSGDGQNKIVSNQVASGAGVANESYWNSSFAADQEVFLTLSTLYATSKGFEVWGRIQSPGTVSLAGYTLYYECVTNVLQVYKYIGATPTQIGGNVTPTTLVGGDKILLNLNGTTITTSYFHSGSWTTAHNFTDSSVSGSGFIGLMMNNDASARADDFGGGALTGSTSHSYNMMLLGIG